MRINPKASVDKAALFSWITIKLKIMKENRTTWLGFDTNMWSAEIEVFIDL